MKAIKFDEIMNKIENIDYKRYVAYVNKRHSMFYVIIDKNKELTYPETDRGKAIFIVIEGKGNVETSDEEKRENYQKGDILIIDGKEKKKFFADEKTVLVEIRDLVL
ncbi:MAG: hypothetical protein ACP6IS_00290 [Candidatus Asgardarchaeia archaeon]